MSNFAISPVLCATISPEPAEQDVPSENSKKSFECDACDATFSRKAALVGHKKTHQNTRELRKRTVPREQPDTSVLDELEHDSNIDAENNCRRKRQENTSGGQSSI